VRKALFMKRSINRYLSLIPCLLLLAVQVSSGAVATSFTYQFTNVFVGTAPASDRAPWIDAVFQDISPGVVHLTISNLNLTGTENVSEFFFNLAPNLNPAKLNFSFGPENGEKPFVNTGVNRFKGNGSGKYDFIFYFDNSDGKNQEFGAGDTLSCDISGISTLTASDFAYLSQSPRRTTAFYAAALIEDLGNSDLTGWISASTITPATAAPEPGSPLLCSLVLSLWLGWRLSKRASRALSRSRRLQPIPMPQRSQRAAKQKPVV
jgi:hypothetical protein